MRQTCFPPRPVHLLALVIWLVAGVAMQWLDHHQYLDLASLAVLLVLAATLSSLVLSPVASLVSSTLGVIAFNWCFISPRGTLQVDLREQLLLLLILLTVSWTVALLMGRQRAMTLEACRQTRQAEQLRQLGDSLRDAASPEDTLPLLGQMLAQLARQPVSLLAGEQLHLAPVSADQLDGLRLSCQISKALGPGTGRHEEQQAWYLPLRGRTASFGAALLPLEQTAPDQALRLQAQGLCDQMGLALERSQTRQQAMADRNQARQQALRNTLLAAIAHDYRTPLACILGAATALLEQRDRLQPEQCQRLALTIRDEALALSRLTENTLQLARLDAPGPDITTDWEALDEIISTVVQRLRRRCPVRQIRTRLSTGLPLVRCNAILLAQLLDNLLDNALKYSPDQQPVEVETAFDQDRIWLRVMDRGPGIAPGWQERIFGTFERGPQSGDRRGTGIGLALCRTIARVSGGQLGYRPREGGGACFEYSLPVLPVPATDTDHTNGEQP